MKVLQVDHFYKIILSSHCYKLYIFQSCTLMRYHWEDLENMEFVFVSAIIYILLSQKHQMVYKFIFKAVPNSIFSLDKVTTCLQYLRIQFARSFYGISDHGQKNNKCATYSSSTPHKLQAGVDKIFIFTSRVLVTSCLRSNLLCNCQLRFFIWSTWLCHYIQFFPVQIKYC